MKDQLGCCPAGPLQTVVLPANPIQEALKQLKKRCFFVLFHRDFCLLCSFIKAHVLYVLHMPLHLIAKAIMLLEPWRWAAL